MSPGSTARNAASNTGVHNIRYAHTAATHEDRKRFHVAAADAHERPVSATAPEGHADAEHESAHEITEPREFAACGTGGKVSVPRIIVPLPRGERCPSTPRHGENPRAHAAGIAHVHPIGDRTHGAEARFCPRHPARARWRILTGGLLVDRRMPSAPIRPAARSAVHGLMRLELVF